LEGAEENLISENDKIFIRANDLRNTSTHYLRNLALYANEDNELT